MVKTREKLLLCRTEGVKGLKDLAATGGFDGPIHFMILAAAQEGVDPDGQTHSRMQPKASACKGRKRIKQRKNFQSQCERGERRGLKHSENSLKSELEDSQWFETECCMEQLLVDRRNMDHKHVCSIAMIAKSNIC